MGSGLTWEFPTGTLTDATSVRIRYDSNNSPAFNGEGFVSGRIEVIPPGETNWGSINVQNWDNNDALVGCREIGPELGYFIVSGIALDEHNTPDGSGDVHWRDVGCDGSEASLRSCSHSSTRFWDTHSYDIGVTCQFRTLGDCESYLAGKFSGTIGSTECTDCEAGKYSSSVGAIFSGTCLPCEAGKAR